MGDHRASIKIEFTMHGVTTETDMWINWWRGACQDLPSAVTDFFVEAELKSMSSFDEEQDKFEAERREERQSLMASAKSKLTEEEWRAITSLTP